MDNLKPNEINSTTKASTIFIDLGSNLETSIQGSWTASASTFRGPITISDGPTPLLTLNKPSCSSPKATEGEPQRKIFQNKTEEKIEITINTDTTSSDILIENLNKKQQNRIAKPKHKHYSEKTQRNKSYTTKLSKKYDYVFLCKFCEFVCPAVLNKMQRIQLHLIHHPNQYVDEKYVDLSVLKKYNIIKTDMTEEAKD